MLTPDRKKLRSLALIMAKIHAVPSAIFLRLIEIESAWNPWATRYEPTFKRIYELPDNRLTTTRLTEDTHQRTSWGLCQVMGYTARVLGHPGPLPALCDPAINLDLGAVYLHQLYDQAPSIPTWRWALNAYNHSERWTQINLKWARGGYIEQYTNELAGLGEA